MAGPAVPGKPGGDGLARRAAPPPSGGRGACYHAAMRHKHSSRAQSPGARRPGAGPRLALALMFSTALPAPAAEWALHTAPPPLRAEVANAAGDRLWVYRREGAVHLALALRAGLAPLRAPACPSCTVDGEPLSLRPTGAQGADSCARGPRAAGMLVAPAGEDRLDAGVLERLANGTRLRCIVVLEGAGYRTLSFSLAGSKQALREAVGTGPGASEQ